ncbi:hypothetical protein RYZ18_07265 [Roseovarius sp. 10]|nr:hypothetical protein [Roseovarius sp. 10]MDV7201118.1 hypothetical protein [Roseovarius sp. 10]
MRNASFSSFLTAGVAKEAAQGQPRMIFGADAYKLQMFQNGLFVFLI